MEYKINQNIPSQIIFQVDKENWAIKITEDGIFFNKELFPYATPDAFASVFIELLERQYNVKFIPKGIVDEMD